MILVSQTAFLNHKIAISSDTVLRVNCAWVKTEQELKSILKQLESFSVFLDLPTGRTKPPIPVLDLKTIGALLTANACVEYFGLTNTIEVNQIDKCRDYLPNHVLIVPKIESILGVQNLKDICTHMHSMEKYLMLDKEDLYTDVKGDINLFNQLLKDVRTTATNSGKEVLELQGVIFAT